MTKARDIASAIPAPSTVSSTELGYLDGVTSAIQTQMDAKAPSSTAVTLTGTQTLTNKTLTNPVIASVVNNTLTSTTGDMIYASGANTPARLGIGSSAQVLTVASGVPSWATPAGGGKVLQVVTQTYSTSTVVTGTTFTATGLSRAITPTLNTSKILVLVQQQITNARNTADSVGCAIRLKRDATVIDSPHYSGSTADSLGYYISGSTGTRVLASILSMTCLDSPATTSSTTYSVEVANEDAGGTSTAQNGSAMSTITLLEIGA